MIRVVTNEKDLGFSVPTLGCEKYLKMKGKYYGYFLSDEFIQPYYIEKRLFFTRMVFPYAPIKIGLSFSVQKEKSFFNDIISYIKKHQNRDFVGCDYISKPQANVVLNAVPDGADYIPWGTYQVDLTRSKEDIFSGFHSKHKNVIRKAISMQVCVRKTRDIKLVYSNIKQTLNRQNVHAPSLKYYSNLVENLGNNVEFYVAELNGNVEGVAVVILEKEMAYYMYGGSCPKPLSGSLNYLQYEIMMDLKNRGIKIYDLVGARINVEKGSKFEGIQRFKSRFGADLVKGYSFRYVFSPLKYKLFMTVVKIVGMIKGFKYEDTIGSLKKRITYDEKSLSDN